MTLSSIQFAAQPLPAATDVIVFWMPDPGTAIVRDIRFTNGDNAGQSLLCWIETPEDNPAGYVVYELAEANEQHVVSDAYVVLKAGHKLHAYSTGPSAFFVASGHFFPSPSALE